MPIFYNLKIFEEAHHQDLQPAWASFGTPYGTLSHDSEVILVHEQKNNEILCCGRTLFH